MMSPLILHKKNIAYYPSSKDSATTTVFTKFYYLTPSVDEDDCSRREAALLRGRGLGFPLHTLLCTGSLSGKKVRPHTEHGTNWDCTEDQAGSSTPSSASGGRRGGSLRRTRDFVTRTIVRVGRYVSHCSCKAVENSWFLCRQDAISNKIPPKIKMDRLKFKLEIVETLAVSPPTDKNI
ncbi:uncharacterized protein TNCV_4236471 [Trichonephila clavipes]|nr:uncharacterized protein TNCV_4236471 [Trichonephila clavipes]